METTELAPPIFYGKDYVAEAEFTEGLRAFGDEVRGIHDGLLGLMNCSIELKNKSEAGSRIIAQGFTRAIPIQNNFHDMIGKYQHGHPQVPITKLFTYDTQGSIVLTYKFSNESKIGGVWKGNVGIQGYLSSEGKELKEEMDKFASQN